MEDNKSIITIPRGRPTAPPLSLDLTDIYTAENRLPELAYANPSSANSLMGFFNTACNLTDKYISWIDFEILQAEKSLEDAKSEVILDKAPEEFERRKTEGKYKDISIKYSEDFRNAVVAKDPVYSERLDILNSLKAVRQLLANKAKSFARAYYSSQSIAENKSHAAANLPFNGNIGQTYLEDQKNFMGKPKIGGYKDGE